MKPKKLNTRLAPSTPNASKLTALVAMGALTSLTSLSAQTISNGTGGGDWATNGTWTGGSVPTGNFDVVTGDTVSSDGVGPYAPAQLRPNIQGTWNINNGSDYAVDRMNNSNATAGGIINVNNSNLTVDRFSGSGYTVNVNSGGSLTKTSTGSTAVTININTGGTYTNGATATVPSVRNLSDGTMINLNNTVFAASSSQVGPTTWDTGTFIINTTSLSSPGDTALGTLLSNNAANVLQLSNQASKQTVFLGRSAGALNFSATDGIIEFSVYSNTDNDNDLMSQQELGGDFNLTSDVELRFEDFAPLAGATGDYIGTSYKLFDDTSDYSDIVPTIAAAVWNIGGADYNVSFTDNLASDGTIVVNGFSAVPEPSTFALLAGLAGFAFVLVRRRK